MDIFNIIFCLQVRLACGYGRSALLNDAAPCRLNGKRRIFCIVPDVAVQIDRTAVCICIGYADAAIFLSKEPERNRIVRFQGEGIRLRRPRFRCPRGMIRRIRP